MSIASELNNLEGNIEDSYDAVNDMGGIIPAQRNMDNLDQAIRTIPQNTGTTYTAGTGIDITNDVISIDNTVVPEFSDLATVATTGDYGDLLNTPTIPTNTSDLVNDGSDGTSTYIEADDLATVATSGSYNDLLNKPTIPAAQVNSDWNSNSGVSQILNKPTLATVATSGSYNDLLNKPTIPAAQVNSDWNANSGVAQILNKPSLATVATSGSYTDLSNKPTIPEPMTVYVDASFATPSAITGVFSDSALTTLADPDDMVDTILAGNTVVVVYDGGQSQELIELSSVNSNSRSPEVGQAFTSAISTNAVFPAPTVVTLLYDGTLHLWSAETTAVPKQFSDLSGTASTSQIADEAVTDVKVDWDTVNHAMLTYQPTAITSNKDLNTAEFCAVGNYCCTTNAVAGTLSNSPTGGLAFKMEVTAFGPSPNADISTSTWVTRWRIITDLSNNRWIQKVATSGTPGAITYGQWERIGKTYRKGDTVWLNDVYAAGRQRTQSSNKWVVAIYSLDGFIASDVTSITFTASGYNEGFGPSGLLFSYNNPTTSQMTFSCSKVAGGNNNAITVNAYVPSATLSTNACCTVKLAGYFTFS